MFTMKQIIQSRPLGFDSKSMFYLNIITLLPLLQETMTSILNNCCTLLSSLT